MGRKTFESLNCKPLPNRVNIVITKDPNFQIEHKGKGVIFYNEISFAIQKAKYEAMVLGLKEVWIIGGQSIYEQTMPYVDRIELTWISDKFKGATYYPSLPSVTTVNSSGTITDPATKQKYVNITYKVNKEMTDKQEECSGSTSTDLIKITIPKGTVNLRGGTEGRKHDSNKPRYSLIPTGTVNQVVQVLEYGAVKYTVPEFCDNITTGKLIKEALWQSLGLVSNVNIQNQSWLKGCVQRATEKRANTKESVGTAERLDTLCPKTFYVDLVTSQNVSQEDLKNLLLDKSIKENIVNLQSLKRKKNSEKLTEVNVQNMLHNEKETLFSLVLQNTDLMNSSILISCREDVKSAAVMNDHTLTTTIKLDSLEVCFVVNATKDLDCYKMTLQLLQAFFNISLHINQFILKEISGIDNWQRVPSARTRYYDAAMRHIDDWWNGSEVDEESNLPHLAHAICCLLFLLWFDEQE